MIADREPLRDTLLAHHPIAHSQTGLLVGCRCGEVRLGEDVIQHVMEKLLDGPLTPWLDAAFALQRVKAAIVRLESWLTKEIVTDNGFAEQVGFVVLDDIRGALRGESR